MSTSFENPFVNVKPSTIHGQGLFASQKLVPGQWIGHYAGPVVEEDGIYVLWIEDDNEQWIGYEGVNSMRFLNHSDSPNAEMHGLECFALQEIPAGHEITIDYGWNDDPAPNAPETPSLD